MRNQRYVHEVCPSSAPAKTREVSSPIPPLAPVFNFNPVVQIPWSKMQRLTGHKDMHAIKAKVHYHCRRMWEITRDWVSGDINASKSKDHMRRNNDSCQRGELVVPLPEKNIFSSFHCDQRRSCGIPYVQIPQRSSPVNLGGASTDPTDESTSHFLFTGSCVPSVYSPPPVPSYAKLCLKTLLCRLSAHVNT